MKIILLEDDATLSNEIQIFLTKNSFECTAVFDGNLAERYLKSNNYDLAILDINVPGNNGFEVCKTIRTYNNEMPILMLTALGEIEDKVTAFNNGADDYLVKPFHFEELMIRIKSLLRRKNTPQNEADIEKIGNLVINYNELKVYRNNIEINLSPKEFKLLTILVKANGRVVTKSQIAENLWDYHIETNQNSIEVYINFLRKKIDKDFDEKLIHTKIGFGYYIKTED
jgi:DNA-binding response OmpR family regulator